MRVHLSPRARLYVSYSQNPIQKIAFRFRANNAQAYKKALLLGELDAYAD